MRRLIRNLHPAPCMTCEEQIAGATIVNWEKGVGIWHLDCEPPANLQVYVETRELIQETKRRGSSD